MKTIYMNHIFTFAARTLVTALVLFVVTSCEEFIEIDAPKTEITSNIVFSNDAASTSAIRGIYSLMTSSQSFTNGEIERYTGLSSDELVNHSSRNEQQQFYFPSLTSLNGVVHGVFWREAYKYINNANAVIEGLSKSTSLSGGTRVQLEGEAKFIRAFCHFYLVNLFGDVPYVTTTDYRSNSTEPRLTVGEVYLRIVDDLVAAKNLLATDYSFSNNNRSQPNRYAAMALLARAYLYSGKWAEAEQEASAIIDNRVDFQLEELDNVFLSNSKEAIWQLQPVVPEKSTAQARIFLLFNKPSEVSLNPDLVTSFEAGDDRRRAWVGEFTDASGTYFYPRKYKVYSGSALTEYSMVLRLAEQYLIRAEARAQMMNLSGAIEDVDKLRQRAGLPLMQDTEPGISQEGLLAAIAKERKFELMVEWGHRWLDLKRTGSTETILRPTKLDWQQTDELYPIPQSERLLNPALSQNPGY
jgi:starch-binding outer membrane protein, SusD/RagB family